MSLIERPLDVLSPEEAQHEWDVLTSFQHWAGERIDMVVKIEHDPQVGDIAVISDVAA